uniref:Alkaline phosphatase n=1 Tax=Alexandrium catenella TaxID=2925 RepID=A0A7S1WP56_ALECA|mmetsp:Transcript_78427/g.208249  ORF Transcript_78427/g.208249 Transcript_78427/m.208249 type:complete len:687 (+) Transcript_78427:64-2124(+)|eukprot:CAMPEP_0171173874 /NCGR_PEP_ID=MMETSP0790-20130122/10442_1 /TAXON_ID=2925 /ORGANISM="Alexandrium catenella, Strain OF101" /LENGTH=686 /DNA_ID=CAMNT_0011638741 /DNA_START=33 /DNA_END=2093 /DNA_ORIENTATION=-
MATSARALLAVWVCAAAASGSEAIPEYTQFYYSKFPVTEAEKGSVVTSPWVMYKGHWQPLQYRQLVRTGNTYGPRGVIAGATIDKDGNLIQGSSGCCGAHPGVTHHLSDMTDFASLLRSRGPDQQRLWSVVHFEDMPAVMQAVEVRQGEDGVLHVVDLHNVDFSAHGGVVGTCAGSVSPWNTHLGGEEWGLPDARTFESWHSLDEAHGGAATRGAIQNTERLSFRYHGLDPQNLSIASLKSVFHPFMNGYPNEVSIDDSKGGSPVITAVKHYSMGRYAVELPYCLHTTPQVCYIADDKSNGVPCAYKPDVANDLTSGRLYCAKLRMTVEPDPQSSLGGAGEYAVEWLDLGHATDAQIKRAIDARTQFADLFEVAELNMSAAAKEQLCPQGFTPVNAGGGPECLKLVGDPILASRLETRRYAAMLGATTEWTKMEGITFDPKRNELYMAMSAVYASMEHRMYKGGSNPWFDIGGFDNIRARYNPCGCVYRMHLGADNFYRHIRPLVCGNYRSFNTGSKRTGSDANSCDIHSIANPDNIAFMVGHDKLLVGEDSGRHENNAVWVYDMTTQSLNRLLTVPRGAETTGIYFHADVNGFAYIMNQVQHPASDTLHGRNGTVGYLGPISLSARPPRGLAAGQPSASEVSQSGVQVSQHPPHLDATSIAASGGVAVHVAAATIVLMAVVALVQ